MEACLPLRGIDEDYTKLVVPTNLLKTSDPCPSPNSKTNSGRTITDSKILDTVHLMMRKIQNDQFRTNI